MTKSHSTFSTTPNIFAKFDLMKLKFVDILIPFANEELEKESSRDSATQFCR